MKRAPVALEAIADEAVEHRDPEAAPRGGGERDPLADAALLHRGVDCPSEARGGGPDGAVGAARDRVVDDLRRSGPRPRAAEGALGDAQMHIADRSGETSQLVEGEGAQRPNLVWRRALGAFVGARRVAAGGCRVGAGHFCLQSVSRRRQIEAGAILGRDYSTTELLSR